MNVERMLYLADQLEHPTDPKLKNVAFDMNFFHASQYDTEANKVCGTVACIGGHACLLFCKEGLGNITGWGAQEALGLDNGQVNKLFYNHGKYIADKHLADISRAEAVEAILRMVNEEIDASWARMEEAEKKELVEA